MSAPQTAVAADQASSDVAASPNRPGADKRFMLVLGALVIGAGASGAYLYVKSSSGWLVLLGGVVAVTASVGIVRTVTAALFFGNRAVDILDNGILVVVSLGIAMLALEGGLAWLSTLQPAQASNPQAQQPISPQIPKEWERRPASIEGAARAVYWHGKLHVYNNDNFRNAGDYELQEGKQRVVVLGDSFTYGDGIATQDTYSVLLEKMWKQQGADTRVYNLGQDGAQSQDVLRTARKWVPILKPERVIYGICLNDFLPSGTEQYGNNMVWQVRLPAWIKVPFETKTRFGALLTDRYNKALMALGVRNDFYADILKDFGNYQERFGHDLLDLNQFVLQETGRPVVAMVLDQYPASDRGYKLSRIAEKFARAAGMDVVPTESYYRKYRGSTQQLYVSQWEGHPNEFVNQIFAEMLAEHLKAAAE